MNRSKNYKRTAIMVTTMSFCLLVLLIVGSSYAYWKATRVQEGDPNQLTTTCLDIDLTNVTNGINLDTQFPITEKEGRKTKGYTFKVTNKCDTYVSYNVNLESLNSIAAANRLNLNYLDAILDDGNALNLGSYPTTESGLQASDGVAYDTRTLTTDSIGPKDSATASKEYTLRVWIDEEATNSEMNKSWSGKISVSASPVVAENAVTKLTKLAKTNTTEMFTDDTADANIRYMGADPANYVDLGNGYYTDDVYIGYDGDPYDSEYTMKYSSLEACQNSSGYNQHCTKLHSKGDPILWRVIGVMNNVDNGTGTKETRLKVIRDEDLGGISWDAKCSSGYNDNEQCTTSSSYKNNWTEASLNKTLNEAYYNSAKTIDKNYVGVFSVDNGWDSYFRDIDFSNTGFKQKSQSLVGDAVYHLGGANEQNKGDYYCGTITASQWYQAERSENVYSDATKTNPTTWTGKVGLMYPSDYGYATSGGSTTDKATCMAKELYNWDAEEYADCKKNDWLFSKANYQWTITPYASNDYIAANVYNYGYVSAEDYIVRSDDNLVRPVLYLKSDVKIVSGNGTQTNPYKLSA